MPANEEVIGGTAVVESLRLGERQTSGPLAVFPLFAAGVPEGAAADGHRGPARYLTLREALGSGQAVVTEVSAGGSVPELRLVNNGDTRVLALDGEELRGAKQNRVLNTTILVGKRSTLVVPVSCTEQGRWAYESPQFAASEVVAERSVRRAMKTSLSASLVAGSGHRADQGLVWQEVGELHDRQGTSSPTGAMRDAYARRKRDLDQVIAAFPLADGQCGVLVLHGARVIGLDFVSRAPQYAELHDGLLRSYAFEALVSAGEPGDRDVADAFLERVAGLPGRSYKSPGLGWDVRFEAAGVLGSALVYREQLVHAAFFDVGGVGEQPGAGRAERRQPGWRIADARERARMRRDH